MKSIFMRVLFCKIHCPSFICFCKPSAAAAAAHLYTPGPLKLENSPHVPSSVVTDASDESPPPPQPPVINEVKEEILEDGKKQQPEIVLRSCIKKTLPHRQSRSPRPVSVPRKKVQWIDNLGKELVDIREFESSETGETDNEEDNRSCLCVIL